MLHSALAKGPVPYSAASICGNRGTIPGRAAFALRLRSQIIVPVTAKPVGKTPQRNTRICQISPEWLPS